MTGAKLGQTETDPVIESFPISLHSSCPATGLTFLGKTRQREEQVGQTINRNCRRCKQNCTDNINCHRCQTLLQTSDLWLQVSRQWISWKHLFQLQDDRSHVLFVGDKITSTRKFSSFLNYDELSLSSSPRHRFMHCEEFPSRSQYSDSLSKFASLLVRFADSLFLPLTLFYRAVSSPRHRCKCPPLSSIEALRSWIELKFYSDCAARRCQTN